MCLLLESIKICDGKVQNLAYHQQRLDASQKALFGSDSDPIVLSSALNTSQLNPSTVFKARLVYGRALESVEFQPYIVKKVSSIRLINCGSFSYELKYADRSKLSRLYEERGIADDVLLVKNGLLTDCSYSNVCLWDGANWFTPSTPLLKGTKRAMLIDKGFIQELEISVDSLRFYKKLSLINAMIDLGEMELPTDQLIF